jgi:hypothetical protein
MIFLTFLNVLLYSMLMLGTLCSAEVGSVTSSKIVLLTWLWHPECDSRLHSYLIGKVSSILRNGHTRDVPSNVIMMTKSRSMRWVGHVACMWKWKMLINIQLETLNERNQFGEMRVDRRIILKRTSIKQCMRIWTAFTWRRIESSSGLFLKL